MTAVETELDVISRLVSELQAEGYEVYIHPKRQLLPEFLRDYAPDAIGLRPDRNIAIEVIRKSPDAKKRAESIASRFEGRNDWELRIVWITPATSPKAVEIQSPATIRNRISEIRELSDSGHNGPALLLAWAAFEAIGRALVAKQFERPQPPGRLVQVMAGDGFLTPTEADYLRLLAEKRNRLTHGGLQTRVTKAELDRFAVILATLHKMIGKPQVSGSA